MDFVRDIIILAIALLLLIKGRFLGALLGIGLGAWAVMDLKRLLGRKRAEKPAQPATEAPSDNKITITDLSDVKEVEVEKEA